MFGYALADGRTEGISTNDEDALFAVPAPERTPAPPPQVVRRFGDYELLEEIDRGAMGVVYRARQVSLDRIVALKMILHGQFAGREAALRFQVEAEAAAKLHHPNIVAIHQTGEHEGQPYFSMDCIEGGNLATLVHARPLPPQRAAALIKTVSEAVHYAHEQGILHRDLKPSNILLDQAGQPCITDFGLAKRILKDSFLTMTGQVLGSPNFMPPEQADTKLGRAGRHSDVYALGAVLFYLLTSRPPFVAESAAETLQQTLTVEAISPKLLNPNVSLDLATICLKCLEKDPTRRYATAKDLAADLARFLSGAPIQARATGPAEKVWRWCRRKPFIATLGAITSLSLLTIATGFPIAYWMIKGEQDATRSNLYAADMSVVQQSIEHGDLGRARQLLKAHWPRAGEPDLRGFEWRHLWSNSRSDELATLQEKTGGAVYHLSFSPDGRTLAGTRKIWTISSSESQALHIEPVFWLPANHVALAFAPGGDLLINIHHKELKLWEPISHRGRLLLAGEDVRVFAFSKTGKWLATGSDQHLRLWDTTTWQAGTNKVALVFEGELWKTIAFSPDERWLMTSTGGPFSRVSVVRYWSVPLLAPLSVPANHGSDIICAASSPDRDEFYTGSVDGTLHTWDSRSRTETTSNRAVRHHRGWISQIIPLPVGQLVTAGADRAIRIGEPNKETIELRGHTEEVWSLAVSPDGQTIASADRHGAIKLWSARSARRHGTTESLSEGGSDYRFQALGFSKSGQIFATLTRSGIKFWNLGSTPPEELVSRRFEYEANDLPIDPALQQGFASISQDFEYFAVARTNQPTELWNLNDRTVARLDRSGPIAYPLFAPKGNALVTASASNSFTVMGPFHIAENCRGRNEVSLPNRFDSFRFLPRRWNPRGES